MKPYFTLVRRDTDGVWYDVYGSYNRADCIAERDFAVDMGDALSRDLKVIKHADTTADMIAAIAALNA